jgi:hypothetical protein
MRATSASAHQCPEAMYFAPAGRGRPRRHGARRNVARIQPVEPTPDPHRHAARRHSKQYTTEERGPVVVRPHHRRRANRARRPAIPGRGERQSLALCFSSIVCGRASPTRGVPSSTQAPSEGRPLHEWTEVNEPDTPHAMHASHEPRTPSPFTVQTFALSRRGPRCGRPGGTQPRRHGSSHAATRRRTTSPRTSRPPGLQGVRLRVDERADGVARRSNARTRLAPIWPAAPVTATSFLRYLTTKTVLAASWGA